MAADMTTRKILLSAILALILVAAPPIPAKADTLTGWYEQQSGTTELLFGVSAVDAQTAWAVGAQGTILKTVDEGVTWSPQASGSTNWLLSVAAFNSQIAWTSGASGTILKTIDGGTTWIPQTSGTTKSLYGFCIIDALTAWAVGGSGTILKTTDGGLSWLPQVSGTTYNVSAISAVDGNIAWAVGDLGLVLKTIDGGASWNAQPKPTNSTLNSVTAVDHQTIWAAGYGGHIVATKDGGATWIEQESGTTENLEGISAADADNVWAVGGTGVMTDLNRVIQKTSDGGASWQSQANGHELALYAVTAINPETAWAVGSKGAIARTTGGGKEYTRYFAEGFTGQDFQEYLCLGNAQENIAQAIITYLFKDGTSKEQRLQIPPLSRTTIDVNSEAGEGKEVSVKVLTDKEITIERPIYFNYKGNCPGGHNTSGAALDSNYWYFAEGYTGPGFEEWICVLNPNESTAYLTFSFQTQEEGLREIKNLTVLGHSRGTFSANDLLGGGSYQTSLRLQSSGRVVAERAIYFDYIGTNNRHWKGGHCAVGVNVLSKEYYFAEGTTRAGFEEWITLQAPTPEATSITALFDLGAGQGDTIQKTYNVQGYSRQTVYVPSEIGDGKDVSVKLTGTKYFLAERPMYFDYEYLGLRAQGGDCVIPTTSSCSQWFFAEGYTGTGFDEWLCLQNPGDTDSVCDIIFRTQEAGNLPSKTISIQPHSRLTVMVNQLAGSDYQLSTEVNVTSGSGIVVERPMYFNYRGWDGGHIALGSARS